MIVYARSLEVRLKAGPDMADVTGDLARIVAGSGVAEGTLAANVVGSTGSMTTIEYEPGVVEDLRRAINRLAPPDIEYEHELAWHDGNGHSHVGAALLGPSLCIQVRGGGLSLGTWQQAVVINHDAKPRTRRVEVTVIGVASNP